MALGRIVGVSAVVLLVGFLASIHANAIDENDEALDALVHDASEAPAEFAADLLIRIAQSPGIHSRTRKSELLETAFVRAYGAQESYKRDAPLAPFDSPAGAVARAYATGLDALTLRLRAVASLVRIDAVRARQLFEGIDFYLPPAACDSMMVPVADEYYGTLATIARRTFADTADGQADALRFFEIYLWRTHVPSEIPAVLKAVKAMRLPRVEAGYFEEALDAMMEHIDRDARGFSTYGLDIVPLMSELADMDRLAGVRGEILMRAERKLLVVQLSSGRCSDSLTETPIAEAFNTIVRRRDLPADLVAPLTTADVWPGRVLGGDRTEPYWQTIDARRLLFELLALRDAAAGPRSAIIKRSAEWQEAAQQYVTDLELWDGTQEPVERDYFDQKSLLYDVYLDLVLPGPLKTRAVRSLVDFLGRSDTGRLPRALWFSNVKRLLDRDDPATVPAMELSGHYLLSIYARVERLLSTGRRVR